MNQIKDSLALIAKLERKIDTPESREYRKNLREFTEFVDVRAMKEELGIAESMEWSVKLMIYNFCDDLDLNWKEIGVFRDDCGFRRMGTEDAERMIADN